MRLRLIGKKLTSEVQQVWKSKQHEDVKTSYLLWKRVQINIFYWLSQNLESSFGLQTLAAGVHQWSRARRGRRVAGNRRRARVLTASLTCALALPLPLLRRPRLPLAAFLRACLRWAMLNSTTDSIYDDRRCNMLSNTDREKVVTSEKRATLSTLVYVFCCVTNFFLLLRLIKRNII